MAASSISRNRYDVSICDECHAEVAWAESKNGRWYLCRVVEYTTDGGSPRHRAMPYTYHECGIRHELLNENGLHIGTFDSYEEALVELRQHAHSREQIAEGLNPEGRNGLTEDQVEHLNEERLRYLVEAVEIMNTWTIKEIRSEGHA